MANNMKPGGATKPKGQRKKTDAAAVNDDEVQTFGGDLPKAATVKSISKELSKLGSDMASLRGQMGSAIKDAEKDHNVHRGALREALKQLKMDPEKRADYQRHVGHYVLALGIARQDDLFEADKAPAASPAEAATFGGREAH